MRGRSLRPPLTLSLVTFSDLFVYQMIGAMISLETVEIKNTAGADASVEARYDVTSYAGL